ncbi:hypothetical protein HPB49_020333 [Dermacentor silvarum]|uniref:Uncharacterized protein n=1 Tax=Dermacentor silvarum TaxID=543639 RepID=A0ACB8CT21_DERSI|nr:hypothetical protein HPB49_020333 [Dermacentor silvarum]
MAASVLQLRAYDPEDRAKMTASNATPAAGSSVGNVNDPVTRATERKGKTFRKWKPRPMIKAAPEDYVLVIKPQKRVSLHEAFTNTSYGTAISAYLGRERARDTSVLPSRDQNIIITHTPDIEAADRLMGDFAVNTAKGSVPLHGYLRQDGGNTCHGVIAVRNMDTTETLQHRACWRAGIIVEIRKFGTSNKARITFAGKEKPRYCGAVGHRAHACPNLPPNTCGLCGLRAPLVEVVRDPHNCVPRCSVCGGGHATNSRDCTAKFLSPKMAAKKGREKENDAQEQKPPSWATQRPAATTLRPGETSGGAAWQNRGLGQCRQKRTPDRIAALRAQNEILLKKINELEFKINQPLSPPSLATNEEMENELVEPKAATNAEPAFVARFEARFGTIDARFAALENQISMMVTAISKLQDAITAMIAQTNCALLAPLAHGRRSLQGRIRPPSQNF